MAGHDRSAVAGDLLVEPFVDGAPGPHVTAACEAFDRHDLSVELGPFASFAAGDLEPMADAIADMIRAAMSEGASSIRLRVAASVDEMPVPTLHDALDDIVRMAEREIGTAAADWTRAQKQRVVRTLDEHGAFLLRGAVDDIAEIMGVSRITIYNYLNALEKDPDKADG